MPPLAVNSGTYSIAPVVLLIPTRGRDHTDNRGGWKERPVCCRGPHIQADAVRVVSLPLFLVPKIPYTLTSFQYVPETGTGNWSSLSLLTNPNPVAEYPATVSVGQPQILLKRLNINLLRNFSAMIFPGWGQCF